nr:bifunctional riboflavin kinase/FAD synthetase [Streptomyces arenae]
MLWRGLDEVPGDWPRCAVTIGVFDGVHRGHARLIQQTREAALRDHLPTVLVTFDPHPARVLGLPRDTAALTTVDRRAELAHQLGVDAVCVLPFTRELAQVSAEEFVERVLVKALHTAKVVVGANFRFGRGGAGDITTLRRLAQQHGFLAESVELLHSANLPCSSSYVRHCLAEGDVTAAAQALGRAHRIDGLLTFNREVLTTEGTALPAPGIYHGRLGREPNATDSEATELEVTANSRLTAASTVRPRYPGEPVSVWFLDRITRESGMPQPVGATAHASRSTR